MSRWLGRAFPAWALALALALAGTPAAALEFIAGEEATLRWTPADGPVAVYGVWIRRSGGSFGELPDLWVEEAEATIFSRSFQMLVVRVAAFDPAGERGPFSPESDRLIFFPNQEPRATPEPARPFDLDGDGITDLVWRSALADKLLLLQLGPGYETRDAAILDLDPGEEVTGSGDFDGDGRADLLLRAGDRYRIWFMDGIGLREERALPPPLGAVEALADFDGDGRTDLLSREGGLAVVTTLAGAAISGEAVLGESALAGTAAPDLDGDGRADVFLYDAPGRASEAWLVDGDRIVGAAALAAPPWPNAELVGVGDVDGDGDEDLLWLRPGSGGLRLWFMDAFDAVPVLSWTFADSQYVHALGDYDGDGLADDALVRDAVTGSIWIGRFAWDGVSESAPPSLISLPSPGPGWLPVRN